MKRWHISNLKLFCIELFTDVPDIILNGKAVNNTLIILMFR